MNTQASTTFIKTKNDWKNISFIKLKILLKFHKMCY